jgi:outer membrane protein assembly factor BamB
MKSKIKLLPITALMFCAFNGIAQTTKTVSGFQHVESVATDGKYIFAADIGAELNPAAKDGDGKIAKLDKKGKILEASFVKEKLNAPKGLAVSKGVLLLNDIDRLVAIDLNSGTKLYEIDFSKDTAFLNDIAVWDNNTLYVSATDNSKLFRVNLSEKSYAQIKTDIPVPGINGLFCYNKGSRLYVNGFGSDNKPNGIIGYVNLKDNTFTKLASLEGYFDGIYINKDVLYVSNWVAFEKKGVVMAISLYSGKCTKLKTIDTVAGPADFIINNDELILPAMISGEIHFVKLDSSLTLKL